MPSDNNSPNRTDYPRETEPGEKKIKGKVLSSDNNSANKTDYPSETEPCEKKERFCLQKTTAQIGLTTQERQNQVEKKERFCLQITRAQIGLTTQ